MMTVKEKSLYEHFAGLLHYPREDMRPGIEEAVRALEGHAEYPPEALDELKLFSKEVGEISLDDLQGIYSYTFELTSEYTLDIGHFLFDGFKRSNYLASLKAMYRENGFPFDEVAGGELPDHLPVLLEFLSRLEDKELRRDVTESFLVMGMEKLNKNFERQQGNLYCHLINAIYRVIDKDVKEEK
ncbi:MAG: nitrate reductase molybdenum cofactor assembly chaperone [Thermodesulfobacteriota bacterium]